MTPLENWRFVQVLALAALVLLALPAAGAKSQTGLTVAPGRVQSDEALAGGRTYVLPEYTVNNQGAGPLVVSVAVVERASNERIAAPAEWFAMEPAKITVPVGESRPVRVSITPALDAPVGAYTAWLDFQGAAPDRQTVAMGAGVQTPFLFTIGNRDDQRPSIASWLWTAGGVLGASGLMLGAAAMRARRQA